MVVVAMGQDCSMTTYEFSLLNIRDQVDLLYQDGVYAGKRKVGTTVATLYQLDGFYVEVFFLKYRCQVERLCAFNSTFFLTPYLQEIDIHGLVGC
jgi:hypothetical protein